MSNADNIKCDICGYKFKTYPKKVIHYFDREPEEVTRYYPIPEEKAHLVREYLCDDCYNKIGDIVMENFITQGEDYNMNLEERKDYIKNKYDEEISNLELENESIKLIVKELKNAKSILDLNESILEKLKNKFPYTPVSSFYLEDALEIEPRTKQGKKKVCEWEEAYQLEIDTDRRFEFVDKETFKEILKNSNVKNMSYNKLQNIIDMI